LRVRLEHRREQPDELRDGVGPRWRGHRRRHREGDGRRAERDDLRRGRGPRRDAQGRRVRGWEDDPSSVRRAGRAETRAVRRSRRERHRAHAGRIDDRVGSADRRRARRMANLIYSAIASLDGYVADEDGDFDWAEPDEQVHAFLNDRERAVGTYPY